jgi:hypothetical protein
MASRFLKIPDFNYKDEIGVKVGLGNTIELSVSCIKDLFCSNGFLPLSKDYLKKYA